jgi:hypothetical protein
MNATNRSGAPQPWAFGGLQRLIDARKTPCRAIIVVTTTMLREPRISMVKNRVVRDNDSGCCAVSAVGHRPRHGGAAGY